MKQQPYLFEQKIQNSNRRLSFLIDKVKRSDLRHYPEHLAKAWKIDIANGGYLEERQFYLNKTNATVFTHAGLDVFVEQQTPILAPFPAQIISFYWSAVQPFEYGHGSGGVMTLAVQKQDLQDYYSQQFLDSLTTNNWNYLLINLIHLDNQRTFELHGWQIDKHQFANEVVQVPQNFTIKKVAAGQPIAFLGNRKTNGGWAIHLHLEMTLVATLDQFTGIQSISLDKTKNQFNTFGVFPGSKQEFAAVIKHWALQDPNKFFKFNDNTKIYNLSVIPYHETEVTNGKN